VVSDRIWIFYLIFGVEFGVNTSSETNALLNSHKVTTIDGEFFQILCKQSEIRSSTKSVLADAAITYQLP
jgi:hypothetical protein